MEEGSNSRYLGFREKRFSERDKKYSQRQPIKETEILIICEDSKSSYYYFSQFCKYNNLTHIVKVSTCRYGTDILSISKDALDRTKEKNFYEKQKYKKTGRG